MDRAVTFPEIREVHRMAVWEATHKFCLGVLTPSGLLVIQLSSPQVRDQWFHSITWKKRMYRHRINLNEFRKPERLVREVKAMIAMCMQEPLVDESIYQIPLDMVSGLLTQHWLWTDRLLREALLCSLAPLLERLQPNREVCQFLSRFCHDFPRSCLIRLRVAPVVETILKHNVDFSKFLHTRRLVQDLLMALGSQSGGSQATYHLIRGMHGPGSSCPHPRVLPNLVAACLGAIFLLHEGDCQLHSQSQPHSQPQSLSQSHPQPQPLSEPQSQPQSLPLSEPQSLPLSEPQSLSQPQSLPHSHSLPQSHSQPQPHSQPQSHSQSQPQSQSQLQRQSEQSEPEGQTGLPSTTPGPPSSSGRLHLFIDVISYVSEYDDWRPGLALLLQPIPFPDTAARQPDFIRLLSPVLRRVGCDGRCEVHRLVLGTREDKAGWLELVCPSSAACPDDGQLWADMLSSLLACCSRRKAFLKRLLGVLGACQLMALRGDATCQEILCQMLEWGLISDGQEQRVTVSTLLSSPAGAQRYRQLCERMNQLRELQSAGGPQALSLPSRSTDHDLAQLLSSGCFGNLETLSLAFSAVTSQCAEQLIRLPNLRRLNLWCTQFGDEGLLLITEHLHKLEVLNLCETYVTNKSLPSLAALKELHTLNLNSTELSADTLAVLRAQLPRLQHLDVRYTDAW